MLVLGAFPPFGESLCGSPFLLRCAAMRYCFFLAVLLAWTASGAERVFNFGEYPFDKTPSNFISAVTGRGAPGEWKVMLDEAPSLMPARDTNAPSMTQHAVLAQLERFAVDQHFPVLVYNDDKFGDFTFNTRFKIVAGGLGQMGGVVFRYQDPQNYYVLVASVLDKHFWFFKIVNGVRSERLIGPAIEISKNEWHEISVKCEGNHIDCLFDGKQIIPMITDDSFSSGKVGFWTKSDSVVYFTDAKVNFTPRETLAQALVSDTVREYSRVLGMKIFAAHPGDTNVIVVAAMDPKELRKPGGKTEDDVVHNGRSYFGRDKKAGTVTVTVPLRDRNGDAVAAVAFVMKAFPGETEETALVKSRTMIKKLEPRVTSLEDLLR
jgi:hypothetical protein